jgi:hypothetical protein
MIEAIVTIVVEKGSDLNSPDEPTHTMIRRLEFESMIEFQAWYLTGTNYMLAEEDLVSNVR